MRLDLWNAEASTEITTTKGIIHLQTFVHADDMIIVVKATTEGDEHDFRWEWIAAEANSPRYLLFKRQGKTNKIPEGYELNPSPTNSKDNRRMARDKNVSTRKNLMDKSYTHLSTKYFKKDL